MVPVAGDEPIGAAPSPRPARSTNGRRIIVLDLPIDDVTLPEALDAVDAMIAGGGVHQHLSVNVAKVVAAHRDPAMRAMIHEADLVTADGQPILWAARLLGSPLRERVTGIDLMFGLIERAASRGYRLYLLGARPEIVDAVAERIGREHPGVTLAGVQHGYWDRKAEAAVVDGIAATKPDILFVALGSPEKEQFLARWKETIGAGFVMGVGGAFDVYSGLRRRAPRWMQRAGLEWFYRLAQDPRRMSSRYLSDGPRFLWLVLKARLARRA